MTVTVQCRKCGYCQNTVARTTTRCFRCGKSIVVGTNITNLPPGGTPRETLRGRIR